MLGLRRLHARCSCSSTGGPFALAGTERQYERSRPFVIEHLSLRVSLDFEEKSVQGDASLRFSRMAADETVLSLDAVGFHVDAVELDVGRGPKRARYTYDGDVLSVTVPARAQAGTVHVHYRASPKRGIYFLAPDAHVPTRPTQVWTQCQDEDARHWLPCVDKPHSKMTTDLTVRVPRDFVVLSNGEQTGRRAVGRTLVEYRFEMTQPLPSYLITLVAGRFDVIEDRPARRPDGSEVPITYYVPEGRAAEGRRALGQTPRMVELFGELTGVAYPWSRYSQIVVSDFIFGGMENTTATTLYEHVLLDERASIDIESEDLVAHELAHHWFGDYVTCRDWSHAWLNEGFATFFEHVERESRLGLDDYEYGIAGDVSAYLSEADERYQRPIVCRDYSEPIDLFDRHLYEKGGLVLHMLRRWLGDSAFWAGVRLHLTEGAHGIVETNGFMRCLERASGRSLERFFDQWVYRPGHPVLKVTIGWERGLLSVSVKQQQKGNDVATFAFALQIEVGSEAGRTVRHEKWVTEKKDCLVVPCEDRPSWVGFDPDYRIVGRVTLEAPADLLRGQLAQASTARLRWMAAAALGKRSDPPTVEALIDALGGTAQPWMVRAAAARALGRIRGNAAYSALTNQLSVSHPKVRHAVVAALGQFRTPEAAARLEPLARHDPSYLVESEAARSLGRTRQSQSVAALLPMLDDPSWGEVKRAAVMEALAELRDDRAVLPVLDRTRYGVPTRARRAAIASLAGLSDERRVRDHLEVLLDDQDPHLRISVVQALVRIGDRRARPALRRALERELDGRVARRIREGLSRLAAGESAERKRLQDEVEGLRRELTELKTRLSTLEARGSQSDRKTRKKKR